MLSASDGLRTHPTRSISEACREGLVWVNDGRIGSGDGSAIVSSVAGGITLRIPSTRKPPPCCSADASDYPDEIGQTVPRSFYPLARARGMPFRAKRVGCEWRFVHRGLAGAACLFQVREPGGRYGRYRNRAAHGHLTAACPEFPAVLGLRVRDRLPLGVRNRVGAAAGERDDVILPVARTTAASLPGRRAGMLALEFPRHGTRSVLGDGSE